MTRALIPLVAVVATAIFFGIAAYINIAEQPARLALADGPLLEEWKISFQVAFAVQSTLTVVAGLASLLAFWRLRDWRWLAAGLLMLANWPWTLVMIQPVNTALLATAAATPETRTVIEHWGLLHGVRTLLAATALCLMVWASARSSAVLGGPLPLGGSSGNQPRRAT
ncbi:DUF1772 domain-containing protein [Mongoliimonas terrestris]|uniref:DUF1772 domain-containing protein n=1 Tax=Mongoliimonas terrestris TaxID=1709001 RepID=UPI000949A936|nr:DUF1772 domain-containing protein [Mongoliimonas terrestris]